VGLPYHWGYRGRVQGDVVNDLLAISEEPNVRIMESKALVCAVVAGRRATGEGALAQLRERLAK
jgi:formate dehydrogenase major subunit